MKAIWLKSHPKKAYFVGDVCEMSKEEFAELSKSKHVNKYEASTEQSRSVDLPEDLPGKDAFINHGITSMADIKQIRDFTEIKGIGKSTDAQIQEYLTAN